MPVARHGHERGCEHRPAEAVFEDDPVQRGAAARAQVASVEERLGDIEGTAELDVAWRPEAGGLGDLGEGCQSASQRAASSSAPARRGCSSRA